MALIGKTTNSGWSKDIFQIYNNSDDDILTLISKIKNGNNTQEISLSFQKTGMLYYLYENDTYIDGYKLCRPYFTEINEIIACGAGWKYSGKKITIPGTSRFSIYAWIDYNNSQPIGVALCSSGTDMYTWTTLAKSESWCAVSLSGYWPYEYAADIYLWTNYSAAANNSIHLNAWIVNKY